MPPKRVYELISESPEWVRLSWAAAITLGFEPGLFYRGAKLTCINLLMQYSDGCKANCAYCGQAREIPGGSDCKNLIRVEWPSYRLSEVIARTQLVKSDVERICISMITHPKAPKDLLTILNEVHRSVDLPISVLITPTLIAKDLMYEIKNAGADKIGIAVDAATPQLFYRLRGKPVRSPHSWRRYIEGLIDAVSIMGNGNVGCHLIVGLGETEKEMVSAFQMVYNLGARTHLFSFFPEPNSALETKPQPPISQYRRLQLARFLIDESISHFENMKFDKLGRIINFGIDEDMLDRVIESGKPFETSGCPGCNRPFANERPGQPIRNFPFPLTKDDIEEVKQQIWLYDNPP
ncbi:radical SAM protein [Candidatus Bathyarchaeota archaeon]|nr:radical SAM protein [Candidatus Bathyarchaeota archaeon]